MEGTIPTFAFPAEAGTHSDPGGMEGWVGLGWLVGHIPKLMSALGYEPWTYTVAHLSTNRDQRRLTSLIEANVTSHYTSVMVKIPDTITERSVTSWLHDKLSLQLSNYSIMTWIQYNTHSWWWWWFLRCRHWLLTWNLFGLQPEWPSIVLRHMRCTCLLRRRLVLLCTVVAFWLSRVVISRCIKQYIIDNDTWGTTVHLGSNVKSVSRQFSNADSHQDFSFSALTLLVGSSDP